MSRLYEICLRGDADSSSLISGSALQRELQPKVVGILELSPSLPVTLKSRLHLRKMYMSETMPWLPHIRNLRLSLLMGAIGKRIRTISSLTSLNPRHRRQSSESYAIATNSTPSTSIQTPIESVTTGLGDWLELIFESCFEMIFGFWMGRHCCPFVVDPKCDIIFRPTRLFSELDAYIGEDWEARNLDRAVSLPGHRQERDRQIDRSLRHAIRSFAARWLHLIPSTDRVGPAHDDIVRDIWRTSRRDMLRVVNRVSYRSVLTLFLFGLTPIPTGISEEEEMDGLTGQICVQTALQQVQRLRERQRNCQFNGAKVSPGPDALESPAPPSKLTHSYLSSESRAYWAALTFDTSASLTLNFRSSLSSGLHGVSSESPWRVLKMGAGSFHTRTEDLRRNPFDISDDIAAEVIAAAAACKLYVWKMIAVLKEALREGDEEEKVAQAWSAFIEAVGIFKVSFRPLLNGCERRLPFLGQVERLNWYELMLHYYLGILILVDAVEAAERSDLLAQLADTRIDAEHEVFNALKFGLESTYTIHGPPGSNSDTIPDASVSASFVAIDPYPHHVVACVQLMNKVVSREYKKGKIKPEAHQYLKSTLLKALEQLPQTSKSVRAARHYLHASLTELEPIPEKQVTTDNVQWPPSVY
ncbi:uncharacterized protein Z518_02617 [Rhinocladiella mackenziei CBS 650.93]|uniref:Uncharacterized protein n=1 Tax=Rhinocladiella mackenziei CBS 650.93 TaxID=1442369 RepID=A0A0D2HBZ3_9EURO|nr:uncharacterized protein Z518_02617 [Rhinocladiella mackenziei CBS 650.93]KIX07963.1 hypothetical protein Z518_02617 [Rhinocladiella mackenziei CBS 650.93]